MVLVFGSGFVTPLIKGIVTSNAKPWLSNVMLRFFRENFAENEVKYNKNRIPRNKTDFPFNIVKFSI